MQPPELNALQRLETIDRIARRVYNAIQPVIFRPAIDPVERREVFKLRGRAVIERGWLGASDLPDGLEFDRFDDESTLIGGWLGSELVAAARVIWPDPKIGTPLSDEFGIVAQPAGEVVHLDRICVAHQRSDATSRLTVALISACWLRIRAGGYHRISGIDSAAVSRLYHRLGFDFAVIGRPRMYWSEERFPILFDPLDRENGFVTRFAARAGMSEE